MFGWITAGLAVIAGLAGFALARGFVRRRLRFVDGIYSPFAPWIAGAVAALVAWPVSLLPFITTATTTVFGVGAGFGTASGVKALKSGER
jgi:hypothetical protein